MKPKTHKPPTDPTGSMDNYIFLFFAASLAGFVWEVLLHLLLHGHFFNRGFFYGPWLPVYGSGAVFIWLLLRKKRHHPLLCFFCSALIGTVTELFAGFLLDTFFHKRYWDYTHEFLNFHGYICLYSALGFAFAGVFFLCLAAPFLLKYWNRLRLKTRHRILSLLIFFFVVDFAAAILIPNSGPHISDDTTCHAGTVFTLP